MEINEYLGMKKELQKSLIDYVNDQDMPEESYQNLLLTLENQKTLSSKSDLIELLHLISKISSNYHHSSHFFTKIEQIFQSMSSVIKQTMTNYQIYNIFKRNKRILLFLIEEQILQLDKFVVNQLINQEYYSIYFYPEIKTFLDNDKSSEIEQKLKEMKINNPEEFKQKRQIGENDNLLTRLIRDDQIKEFVSIDNEAQLSPSMKIQPSIFETNSYLIENKPTLMEYSAFFNSIQIFMFICTKQVNFDISIWLYAIHGNSFEIIHFLEENNCKPDSNSIKQFIDEAIKCHHNEIVEYLITNYLRNDSYENDYCILSSLEFFNFSYFPKDMNNAFVFYRLCEYDYVSLVEIILRKSALDINMLIILELIYLFNFKSIYKNDVY